MRIGNNDAGHIWNVSGIGNFSENDAWCSCLHCQYSQATNLQSEAYRSLVTLPARLMGKIIPAPITFVIVQLLLEATRFQINDVTLVLALILLFYKCFCVLIGFLTIRLGYKLINDGVKGEFNFTGEYNGIKGGLISSSPGLLFVGLGTFMICFGIFTKRTLSTPATERTVAPVHSTRDEIDDIPQDTLQFH